MKKYIIAGSSDLATFKNKITKLLNAGWELYGPLNYISETGYYMQPMVHQDWNANIPVT